MTRIIPRCFDSHTHLLALGQIGSTLNLSTLKSATDFQNIKIQKNHFRGDWLVGFGWDQNNWESKALPTKLDLDQFFPNDPCCFVRADGHVNWLNSRALEVLNYDSKSSLVDKVNLQKELIVQDAKGVASGIFFDSAKIEIDQKLPTYTHQQKKSFLLAGISQFNRAGYTHIRDMSGFFDQWQLLKEIEQAGQLSLYVDQFFTCENIEAFPEVLSLLKQTRGDSSKHLRARGIKIFLDGSLGSEGACISQNYQSSSSCGLLLWKMTDVRNLIVTCWLNDLEVAVHCIGDQSARLLVEECRTIVDQGISGILNIEHAQILKPETIRLLKLLDVTCHMQPCHWLSDKKWLKSKIGSLFSFAFPWAELQRNGIKLQFSSDAPIEAPSIANNLLALKDSALNGISELNGSPLKFMSHPDLSWGSSCKTLIDKEGQVLEVFFDQKKII